MAHPLFRDSDGNGKRDGSEDPDGEQLKNSIELHTLCIDLDVDPCPNPLVADTDGDGTEDDDEDFNPYMDPDADPDDSDDDGGDDQYIFMAMQAQVAAGRHVIDEKSCDASIKTIKKDVPRTDRKGGYFCDEEPHRLKWLHDILVTYAVMHPKVGYAQGMNDVLSMILAVMDQVQRR